VVIGQCKEKGLKLAHLPRNPAADYAYPGDQIPDDCKWGMEEWCKEWTRQGLDPKQQLRQVVNKAKDPFEYLRSIFLDYGHAGIRYPLNTAVLTTGARSICDATDRPDQRTMLIDLLHDITKAPKGWIKEQVERRATARFQESAEEQPATAIDLPAEEDQVEISTLYFNSDDRPIDVHLSNQLLSGEVVYGSSANSLFSYDNASGFWSRIPQDEALRMVQSEIEQVYVMDRFGRTLFPYGSSHQISSCLTALTIKASNSRLANPELCIAFKDQTYDCKTAQPKPHSADHGITYGIEAPLLIREDCPDAFSKAIDTCFGHEAMPVLRAWIRAIIDPTIPYGKFLLIIGNTGTGKGMLLEFIDKLLPTQCRSELLEPGDISGPDKVYQYVLGKRYVSFEDLPHRLKSMQLFYKLVENAEVSARKLNASSTETAARNCRFSAAATKLPTLSDGNDGLVRRALVLTTKPRLGSPNRNLKATIVGDTAEHIQLRGEVMGWALSMERQQVIDTLYGDACSDFLDSNLEELEANADAVAHFVDECLVPATAEVTPVVWSHFFDCFRAYCDKKGYSGKGSESHFKGRIRAKLPHLHRSRKKESMADARAAGRDRNSRLVVPACDWGYDLSTNAFTLTPMGHKGHPANFTSNGLFELRAHNPACPRDTRSNTENTMGQNQDAEPETSVSA
jgi:phage/plasmid-associated DNA primase